jgi:membrane fusion protein, multidrug efflux system
MLKLKNIAAFFLVSLIVTVAGCKKKVVGSKVQEIMSLQTAETLQTQIYPTLTYVAKVEAKDKLELMAQVSGYLEKRLFKEGSFVQKGDILYQIDPAPYQARVRQAMADLAKAEANAKNAKIQYERAQNLFKTKNISESKLDDAQAAYLTSNAAVLQAKAQAELAEIDLKYSTITAPISGRIGKSNFSQGELIGTGSGVLATIVSVDPIYAAFSISENDVFLLTDILGKDRDISSVEVLFKWSNGREYPHVGALDFIDSSLNEYSNTLEMRAVFPNPQGELIPGQFGSVEIKKKTAQTVLLIPQIALQQDLQGRYVLVVGKANKLEVRRVTTGVENGDMIVVTAGLEKGEKVLLEGFQKVVAGMEIKPVVKVLSLKTSDKAVLENTKTGLNGKQTLQKGDAQ